MEDEDLRSLLTEEMIEAGIEEAARQKVTPDMIDTATQYLVESGWFEHEAEDMVRSVAEELLKVVLAGHEPE